MVVEVTTITKSGRVSHGTDTPHASRVFHPLSLIYDSCHW